MRIGSGILLLSTVEVALMGLLTELTGAFTLIHRRIFFTESFTHATFPGATVGMITAAWFSRVTLGQRADFIPPSALVLVGATFMYLSMIQPMRRLSQVPGTSSQLAAGVVLTLGSTLGYLLNKRFAPLPIRVDSFLTGSVFNVNRVDIIAVGTVLALTVPLPAVVGRFLIFYSFDPLEYCVSGLKLAWAEGTVMAMIILTIVMLVPVVGMVLPIALIAALTAVLAPQTRAMSRLLIGTPILSMVTSLTGLLIVIQPNLPADEVITVVRGVIYLVSTLLHWVMTHGAQVRAPPLRRD